MEMRNSDIENIKPNTKMPSLWSSSDAATRPFASMRPITGRNRKLDLACSTGSLKEEILMMMSAMYGGGLENQDQFSPGTSTPPAPRPTLLSSIPGDRYQPDHVQGSTENVPASCSAAGGGADSRRGSFAAEPLPPGHVEERFKVDRKKLEAMITGTMPNQVSVTEFFDKIMQDTGTVICWPARLKIGAKSKKDPHVKIIGPLENVCVAKARVLTTLDIKSNRVTLKMDVSHSDHSHIIGRGGITINQVMERTGCHVHFPDSNRSGRDGHRNAMSTHTTERSNQVSIAGDTEGVEEARRQIRHLTPLIIAFEAPIRCSNDSTGTKVAYVSDKWGVDVTTKPQIHSTTNKIVVKGSTQNVRKFVSAVSDLMALYFGDTAGQTLVSTKLEMSTRHYAHLRCKLGDLAQYIRSQTGADLLADDMGGGSGGSAGTVRITGRLHHVLTARMEIINLLPLVLIFDMREDTQNVSSLIAVLQQQSDVYISVKDKPRQQTKCVIIKTAEKNASHMYRARKVLLGLDTISSPLPAAVQPDAEVGHLAAGLLPPDPLPSPVVEIQAPPGCVSDEYPGLQVATVTLPGPWDHLRHPPPRTWTDLVTPTTNQPGFLSSVEVSLCNASGSQQGHSASNRTIPGQSPSSSHSCDMLASSVGSLSLRRASMSGAMDQQHQAALAVATASGRRHSRSGALAATSSAAPLAGRGGGEPRPSDSCDHMKATKDRRGMMEDYDVKKIIAAKAMQDKIQAQNARCPTDTWSGLGFSRSMPDHVIRERLLAQGAAPYQLGSRGRPWGGPVHPHHPPPVSWPPHDPASTPAPLTSGGTNKSSSQADDRTTATSKLEKGRDESGGGGDGDGCAQAGTRVKNYAEVVAATGLSDQVTHQQFSGGSGGALLGAAGGPKGASCATASGASGKAWLDAVPESRTVHHASAGATAASPLLGRLGNDFAASSYIDCFSTARKTWQPLQHVDIIKKPGVLEFLTCIALERYTLLFMEEGIDLETLLRMKDDDLRSIGVSTFGARRKIILAASEYLKNREAAMQTC